MLECFLKLLGHDLATVICLCGIVAGGLIYIVSQKGPGQVPGEMTSGIMGQIGLSILFLSFVLFIVSLIVGLKY